MPDIGRYTGHTVGEDLYIICDTTNDRAWIQSDYWVAIGEDKRR